MAALARNAFAASSMPVGERHRGRAAGGLSRPGRGDTFYSVSQAGEIGIEVGAAVKDKKQQNSPAKQDREHVSQANANGTCFRSSVNNFVAGNSTLSGCAGEL